VRGRRRGARDGGRDLRGLLRARAVPTHGHPDQDRADCDRAEVPEREGAPRLAALRAGLPGRRLRDAPPSSMSIRLEGTGRLRDSESAEPELPDDLRKWPARPPRCWRARAAAARPRADDREQRRAPSDALVAYGLAAYLREGSRSRSGPSWRPRMRATTRARWCGARSEPTWTVSRVDCGAGWRSNPSSAPGGGEPSSPEPVASALRAGRLLASRARGPHPQAPRGKKAGRRAQADGRSRSRCAPTEFAGVRRAHLRGSRIERAPTERARAGRRARGGETTRAAPRGRGARVGRGTGDAGASRPSPPSPSRCRRQRTPRRGRSRRPRRRVPRSSR